MRVVRIGEGEAHTAPMEGGPTAEVLIGEGGREETLEPGAMALIGVGERVALTNPSDSEEAELLAFFAPAGFVGNLASLPVAGL